jgi:hypothetical protein
MAVVSWCVDGRLGGGRGLRLSFRSLLPVTISETSCRHVRFVGDLSSVHHPQIYDA